MIKQHEEPEKLRKSRERDGRSQPSNVWLFVAVAFMYDTCIIPVQKFSTMFYSYIYIYFFKEVSFVHQHLLFVKKYSKTAQYICKILFNF